MHNETKNDLLDQVVKKIIQSLKTEPSAWKIVQDKRLNYILQFVEGVEFSIHFQYYLDRVEVIYIKIKESTLEVPYAKLQIALETAIAKFYEDNIELEKQKADKQQEDNLNYALTIL
jgi:hypothetical protein